MIFICEKDEFDDLEILTIVSDKYEADSYIERYKKYVGYTAEIITLSEEEFFKDCDNSLESRVRYLANMAKIYLDELYTDSKYINLLVCWGDWRHEHQRLNELVTKAFNLKLVEERETEEDGSDCYSALHIFSLPSKEA